MNPFLKNLDETRIQFISSNGHTSSLTLIYIFHMKSTHQIRASWHCARQLQLAPYSSVLVYTLLLSCKTFLGVGVFFSENSETSWGQRPCIGFKKNFFYSPSQQGMGPLLLICTAQTTQGCSRPPVLRAPSPGPWGWADLPVFSCVVPSVR